MNTKRIVFCLLIMLAIVVGVYRAMNIGKTISPDERKPYPDKIVIHPSPSSVSFRAEADTVVPATETVESMLDEEPPNKNVIEMRNMVAAHLSLLNTAVADPCSAENQKILQQMMFKVLADSSNQSSK